MSGLIATFLKLVKRPALVILAFHRVVDDKMGSTTEGLHVEDLDWIVSSLMRRFTVLPLSQAVDAFRSCDAPNSGRRMVVLTFDDGFRDVYDLAFPVLRRHSAPATVFLVTGCTDTGRLPWFVKLDHLLAEAGVARCREAVPDGLRRRSPDGTDHAGGLRTFFRKALTIAEREELLDTIWKRLSRTDEAAMARELFLTWQEVVEMNRNGIEVGAHTVNHPDVATLDEPTLEAEILGSRRAISERLERGVDTFAFPWGDPSSVTAQAVDLLERNGFRAAVSSIWGANPSLDKVYELRRKGRRFSSRLELRLEVCGWLDGFRLIRGREPG